MSETNPTTAPSEPDAVQRASHVFEAWLLRKERGSGEPFDDESDRCIVVARRGPSRPVGALVLG